jgi:ubiquinone/menaquinone biosynthesis C-methylase UbiE
MQRTLPAASVVAEDFDRIARIARPDEVDRWGRWVIERVPTGCGAVLEVGCGTGAVARRLAEKAERVVALDVSPEMVRVARRCSVMHANLAVEEADFMKWPVPAGGFDAVVSIAALHHVPMAEGLARMASALRPGGTLLVIDLFDSRALIELPYNGLCWLLRRLARPGRPAPEAAAAWRAHEEHDRHERIRTTRAVAARALPGATVRRHLMWRYSLHWRRPS